MWLMSTWGAWTSTMGYAYPCHGDEVLKLWKTFTPQSLVDVHAQGQGPVFSVLDCQRLTQFDLA